MGNSKQKPKESWYSRRHETSKAHDESVIAYQRERGKAARRYRASQRLEAGTHPARTRAFRRLSAREQELVLATAEAGIDLFDK